MNTTNTDSSDSILNLNSEELRDLIGLIVHSYNNHLTGIMGYTEIAQLETCQSDHAQAFEQVLKSGNEAVALGHDLLAVIGRSHLSIQSISLQQLVDEMTNLAKDKNIDLEITLSENFSIETDRQHFVQSVFALVEFIDQYSRQKEITSKPIGVEINLEKQLIISAVNLELSDEESLSLFNPFYSSRVLMGQKSVGLAKVKGFFKQTGVDIEWQRNKGFCIQF